jgi:hypothetical protein
LDDDEFTKALRKAEAQRQKELAALNLSLEERQQQERTRKNILTALSAPPVVIHEDRPPMRLPTKEEKELIKLALFSQIEQSVASPIPGPRESASNLSPNHSTIRPFSTGASSRARSR